MKGKVVICGSIKGGTGKTLISANIGLTLRQRGKRVALIDADIDSPNLAEMLGANNMEIVATMDGVKPIELDDKVMLFSMSPISGLKHVSKTGTEYVQILEDIVRYGDWGERDYWVIDLPAGSSDVMKGVIGLFAENLIGMVLVSQPSNPEDLFRAVSLCKHYNIAILGVIENMAGFECPKCKKVSNPLGPNTEVRKFCKENNIRTIGRIPLSEEISRGVRQHVVALPKKYQKPIQSLCDVIEKAEVDKRKVGLWKGLSSALKRVEFALSESLISFFARFVDVANTKVDVSEIQARWKLYDERVVEVILTSPGTNRVVLHEYFRVRNGKIRVVKEPRNVNGGFYMDIRTFARVLLGEEDFKEAWLSGDIRTFGLGSTNAALFFFKDVWSSVQAHIKEDMGILAKKLLGSLGSQEVRVRISGVQGGL